MSRTFSLDFSGFEQHLNFKEKKAREKLSEGLQDSVEDLERISTNIAPILDGDLRQSAKTEVNETDLEAELTFSVINYSPGYGPFNYAYWTHEMTYKLGPVSSQSPGTDGYTVGNKYVERPLKGESKKYEKWMADKVREAMD